MEFTLKLKLGNAAMTDPSHVRDALEGVCYQLGEFDGDLFPLGASRPIRDCNGNLVGEWEVR